MPSRLLKTAPSPGKGAYASLYKEAEEFMKDRQYVKAIDIFNKIFHLPDIDYVLSAKLHADIGAIYFELKDFEKAFENHEKALQIYAQNNLYDLQLAQYIKIGGLQQGIWQFKKAIDLFQQGLTLSKRLGKMDQIIEFEIALGNVYNWADQLSESERFLLSAIEKEKRFPLPLSRLKAHLSYAILLRKMKNYEEAGRYFNTAMKISAENNNALLMDITKSYGIMQYEMKNYNRAEELLLEAVKKAEDEGNDATRAAIFEYLAKLYDYKKDYEKAYFYVTKYYNRKIELLERGYSEENNILTAKIGLEDARRERVVAEEMANAKSLFIATISHEIRTPMNIILGTSSLMLKDKPKKSHIQYLEMLKRSGENLLGIINDILDVSKIEAGRLEIEYEPVVLQELFENIFSVLNFPAEEKGLQLTYSVDSKIVFAILSDPLRLTQVITNLINNSIKFTAKGNIHFSVKLKNKKMLEIIVRDTGIGIPKNKLKTIFDQYDQVRTSLQKKYKGTGLGLSISKQLVELLHGNIIIKSKVNVGTEFIITLPFEKAELQKNLSAAAAGKDAAFLKNKTILIADDLEDNRFILKETLLFFNKKVKIMEAVNGKQALEKLKEGNIDLVIMDLDMPEMNGFEALSEIRKNKRTKQLKVAASTASVITNGEEDFIEFGFDAYLPKPFDMDAFFTLLEKLIK
jgi:signal transduction histidine kinase/CheY-like chemotaxis protein/Tfp pilus assembly protein PilF